jgi:hypothetical protein
MLRSNEYFDAAELDSKLTALMALIKVNSAVSAIKLKRLANGKQNQQLESVV